MKSASELESELCRECPIYGQTGCDHCHEDALQYVIGMLDQGPKTGHWVKHNTPNNTYYYDCSLCGCVAPCTETADSYLWKLSNFCPDCGAKMHESQESEVKDGKID